MVVRGKDVCVWWCVCGKDVSAADTTGQEEQEREARRLQEEELRREVQRMAERGYKERVSLKSFILELDTKTE